ncbi:MAG: hypothetical protein N4A47_06745 [Clostridia bacterium]|jgi:hypothetical protein|nr:hypothetical protein [Clostridia bacterium]
MADIKMNNGEEENEQVVVHNRKKDSKYKYNKCGKAGIVHEKANINFGEPFKLSDVKPDPAVVAAIAERVNPINNAQESIDKMFGENLDVVEDIQKKDESQDETVEVKPSNRVKVVNDNANLLPEIGMSQKHIDAFVNAVNSSKDSMKTQEERVNEYMGK